MISFTCDCCGYTQQYGDAEVAFHAGWDCAPRFSYTACPLCPGVCAVNYRGLCSHKLAHAHWAEHGRPTVFNQFCVADLDWGMGQTELQDALDSVKAKILGKIAKNPEILDDLVQRMRSDDIVD